MSVLVDTGVFYAHQDKGATDHEAAERAMEAVARGRLGRAFTSGYIFDEAVTLTLVRTRSHKQALTVADRILGRRGFPRFLDMLMMTGPTFREAVAGFERYQDQGLSFTDASTIALMRRRGIDRVLSFDGGFDGLVERIDPTALAHA